MHAGVLAVLLQCCGSSCRKAKCEMAMTTPHCPRHSFKSYTTYRFTACALSRLAACFVPLASLAGGFCACRAAGQSLCSVLAACHQSSELPAASLVSEPLDKLACSIVVRAACIAVVGGPASWSTILEAQGAVALVASGARKVMPPGLGLDGTTKVLKLLHGIADAQHRIYVVLQPR